MEWLKLAETLTRAVQDLFFPNPAGAGTGAGFSN